MKISWTTFKVADLKRSVEFYNEILGLPIVNEIKAGPKHIIFLGDEGSEIELIEGEGVPSNPGEGVSVGIVFENAEALAEKLKGLGKEVIGPISPNPNLKFFFVSDPDGYTIQLCEVM